MTKLASVVDNSPTYEVSGDLEAELSSVDIEVDLELFNSAVMFIGGAVDFSAVHMKPEKAKISLKNFSEVRLNDVSIAISSNQKAVMFFQCESGGKSCTIKYDLTHWILEAEANELPEELNS